MTETKISETIEIPEGMNVELDRNILKISKNNGVLERRLGYPIEVKDRKIIISCEKAGKKYKKLIKTTKAHIKNMIKGLEEKYVYKLQACSVHFPMNISVQGDELVIKNFLGEKEERRAKILPGVEAKVEKDIIILKSSDKEKAGQTAANIERATKIKKRDRRVFQDGIYITEKKKGAK